MKYATSHGMVSAGQTVKFISNGNNRVGKVRYVDMATLTAHVYVEDNTGGYTIEVPACDLEPLPVEQIEKPKRYNKVGKLECWDVIIDQEMNFLEGNILKYVWRYKEKNGLEDLKKARVYLDKLISEVEKK